MIHADAIVILGGGVRKNGILPPWVENRLDRAVELQAAVRYIILLSAGTTHKPPPLDQGGYPIFESIACAKYLISRGVRSDQILPETISYDTIGNAYFSRLIHADPLDLRRLLVVTSEFHMPRTEAAFRWVYGLRGGKRRKYELDFVPVENVGLDEDVLAERVRREQESIEKMRLIRERINTLQELHKWLYTEHQAYAVAEIPSRASGNVINTY